MLGQTQMDPNFLFVLEKPHILMENIVFLEKLLTV